MHPGLPRILLVEAIRYLGVTQAGAVVILHGAWILLALATVQDSDAGNVTRPLMRAYAWLGGVDRDGVGGEANLLAVWAKLSLALYVVEALARRMFGPRAPTRAWVLALGSGGIALVGYGLGFLRAGNTEDLAWLLMLALVLALLAALAMAWALFARWLAEAVVARIESAPPEPPAA